MYCLLQWKYFHGLQLSGAWLKLANKGMMRALFASLCCFLWLVSQQPCMAFQCRPDNNNPCIARCNGTLLDISKVFDYPVKITDDPRGYVYWFNPCSGYEQCPDQIEPAGKDTAICQKADRYYNCGRRGQPIWLLEQWGVEPFVFKIEYPWGSDWRITVFTFVVEDAQEVPTVTFMGERPYLQYNFLVTGRCIGQPDFEMCRTGQNPKLKNE